MLNKKVIILVADNNYVDHAKSIAVNCVSQGGWDGDFAVICPTNTEAAAEFRRIGFHVFETEFKGFMQKFSIFDKWFKQWDMALYLDCDILVQDDLSRLVALLDMEDKIWMDTEDGSTLETFWRDPNKEANQAVYQWMQDNYPNVNKQTFNSAFILFRPNSIPDGTPNKLLEIQKAIEPVNRMDNDGTDQQVINLLLWDYCKKIPRKLVCFWGLAEPINDVDSEWRQFNKGDIPVAIHYCRWHAPWIKKTPDADAYRVLKLEKSCYELYHENLSKFETIFVK